MALLMADRGHADMVKILFELEQDEDGYAPASCEYLWAKPLGGNLFEVDNIPFFVKGISTGDVVLAAPDHDNNLRFQTVDAPSGDSTLRVILFRESDDGRPIEERAVELRARLSDLGCSSEQSHLPGLIAVDVPPEVELNSVTGFLAAGAARDLWDYEEAALRH